MSKKSIVLVVLLTLAVLAATLWIGMRLGIRSAAQLSATSPMTGGNRSALLEGSSASVPALQLNQGSPPWANVGPDAAITGMPGKADQAERQKKIAELKSMQMALVKSMQESRRADPKQVDALLVKIKEVTGTSTVNGIDIDALRGNLAKVVEIQRIATDLQNEVSKQGGADPKKIKAYTAQLKTLQQQYYSAPLFQTKPSGGSVK
ncbi:MAG: hypothetical protein K8H84_08850 [Sulfuricella denitrificans]|nr:hypothetical protein [Sulfuricella denitrificans]